MTKNEYVFNDYTKISLTNISEVTPHKYFYVLIGITYSFLLLPIIQLLPELQNWSSAQYDFYSQYRFPALLIWNVLAIVSVQGLLSTFFMFLRVRHLGSLHGFNRLYISALLFGSVTCLYIPFATANIQAFIASLIFMLLAREHIIRTVPLAP